MKIEPIIDAIVMIGILKDRRDKWKARAELAEQENKQLKVKVEELVYRLTQLNEYFKRMISDETHKSSEQIRLERLNCGERCDG